jgi:D-xylose transport system substrate-binding protein
MKSMRSCALCSTCAIAVAFAAPACAKDIVVGFEMKTHQERKWTFNEQDIKDKAAKLGVKVIFQWPNDNPALQASQFENLLSQKPDVIVLDSVDSSAAGRLVDDAHSLNIPVIGFDVGVSTAKLDFKVMRDDVQTGELQAQAALKFAPHGIFAIIKGDPATDIAHTISDTYDRVLKGQDVKVVYNQFTTTWDPGRALAAAENVLSAQKDNVNAFLTMNDGMASGVARAVAARNLGGKVFISGLDGDTANLRLIGQGVQTMTVWQDLAEENQAALQAAVALAQGKKPELKTIMVDDGAGQYPAHPIGVMAITRDNLCEYITKIAPPGWVKVSEVFPDNPDACQGK